MVITLLLWSPITILGPTNRQRYKNILFTQTLAPLAEYSARYVVAHLKKVSRLLRTMHHT